MVRSRTTSTKEAQARYEKGKLAAGEHIQINVKLKAEADVDMMSDLRERFAGESDPAIVRKALRELHARSNAPKKAKRSLAGKGERK